MARNKISLVFTVSLLGGTLLLLGVGGYLVSKTGGSDKYRTVQPLDYASYLEDADALSGNTYKVIGSIENSLAWDAAKGHFISVNLDGDKPETVAVFVPLQFAAINLQKNEHYEIEVKVGAHGILFAQNLQKN